jgi:hypothetical protein
MHIEIMRTYYYITQWEDTPQPGRRHSFHAEYTKKQSELQLLLLDHREQDKFFFMIKPNATDSLG